MALFRRGKIWWYKFNFQCQYVRESARTSSRAVAIEAERARRRELELAINHIPRREKIPFFKAAAERWLESKSGRTENSIRFYNCHTEALIREFGKRLVCDITLTDIQDYQNRLHKEGKAGRTINIAVGCLRGVLKQYGLWSQFSDRVKNFRARDDVGRAITQQEELALLKCCASSRSQALLPMFIIAIDTGIRASELRNLQHRNLKLTWENGIIKDSLLIVGKSKTSAGTGRAIPLTHRVCSVLATWLARFPDATSDAYVFPHMKFGSGGFIYDLDLTRPIGDWNTAWDLARKSAQVQCRWHDLRHTFVSRLAENPSVSEQTIRSLAGHVSNQMLQRYSHIRIKAKQVAIAGLAQHSDPDRHSELTNPVNTPF